MMPVILGIAYQTLKKSPMSFKNGDLFSVLKVDLKTFSVDSGETFTLIVLYRRRLVHDLSIWKYNGKILSF